MGSTNQEIKENILKAVNKTVFQFNKNPFHFLSESDVQCCLFSSLREKVPDEISINKDLPFSNLKLINTEYSEKVDVVCLDPEKAKEDINRNHENPLNKFLWRLPILVGIELKLVRYEDKSKGFDICLEDKNKLQSLCNRGQRVYENNPGWIVLTLFQNHETLKEFLDKKPANAKYFEIENEIIDFNKIYLLGRKKNYQIHFPGK